MEFQRLIDLDLIFRLQKVTCLLILICECSLRVETEVSLFPFSISALF